MAKIDLERRAEIGREKRARTKAQLIAAAKALFSERPWESVTIDEVVNEAGVAKGTFYGHFNDMNELAAVVADELIQSFDELIQPQRLSISDPLVRIAFGCHAVRFNQESKERPARCTPTVSAVRSTVGGATHDPKARDYVQWKVQDRFDDGAAVGPGDMATTAYAQQITGTPGSRPRSRQAEPAPIIHIFTFCYWSRPNISNRASFLSAR
jgi:AcrR family transcriptional regulator